MITWVILYNYYLREKEERQEARKRRFHQMIENEKTQLIRNDCERTEQHRKQQEGIRKRYSLESRPEASTEESMSCCNNCVLF